MNNAVNIEAKGEMTHHEQFLHSHNIFKMSHMGKSLSFCLVSIRIRINLFYFVENKSKGGNQVFATQILLTYLPPLLF